MSEGKYQNRRHGFSVRPIAILLAVALLIGGAVGGTLAWLTASTEKVENTFTVGDVVIKLEETKILSWNNNSVPDYDKERTPGVENKYKLIPGNTYLKDPVVTVTKNSENCYLFIKFEEINTPSNYIDYTSMLTEANGWYQHDDLPDDVWYREVSKSDKDQEWKLLAGNATYEDGCITINAERVTKQTMDVAKTVSLKYTAYAIQKANINTVKEAWEKIPGNS